MDAAFAPPQTFTPRDNDLKRKQIRSQKSSKEDANNDARARECKKNIVYAVAIDAGGGGGHLLGSIWATPKEARISLLCEKKLLNVADRFGFPGLQD